MGSHGPRLRRALGLRDAVIVGLSSMLGAGVFTAIGPAAGAAGSLLLVGLVLAGAVAYCNAMSSAWLAARYPESGGTYVYGRARLGPAWGALAGWAFVIGKTASCAAMALAIGAYAWPAHARPVAAAAVVVLVGINYVGIERTARAARVILVVTVAVLTATVVALIGGGTVDAGHFTDVGGVSPHGVLQAGAFFFFAFAGYARIATLGEEVRDPERIIPRAIPLALGLTFLLYLVVCVSALAAAGPGALAASPAPLASAVANGSLAGLEPVVRAGAVIASAGVLLALIAGISRTGLAMGRGGDLPGWFAAIHPRHRTPYRAEIAVGVLVIVVLLFADLRGAIGFSSFAVLGYYAIANASAWTLPAGHARGARVVPALGMVGCVVLAFVLPWQTVVAGVTILLVGAFAFVIKRALTGR